VACAVVLVVAAGGAPAWTQQHPRPLVVTQVHNVTSSGAVEQYIWLGSSAPGSVCIAAAAVAAVSDAK
jgi:hypothetical protein